MKQKLLKLMCLLCVSMIGMSAWATDVTKDVTLSSGTYATDHITWTLDDVITITQSKGSSSTAVNESYIGSPRFYAGHLITFEAASGVTLKSIVISGPTGTGNNSISKFGDNTGWTINSSDGTATWSGSASSASITSNAQVRPTGITITYETSGSVTPTCATPTFSVADGTAVVSGTTVELSTTTDGATIYYTTDGTNPTTSSSEYTGAINIDADMTIKAIAVKDGNDDSNVASASYTIIAVTDGVFDFSLGYDYGASIAHNSQVSTATTFTAGNITLTTSGNFAVYDNNTTFRLYSNASFTLAAPDGYVITEIAFEGIQNLLNVTVNTGEITGNATAATWTGKSQSVTVTCGAGNPFYTKITVLYEQKTGNEIADASIDATNITVGQGTATITTNPTGLIVSYASDATGVATVDAAGVVTPVAAGTANITATWDEQTVGGKTYDAGSKTFEVNVYAFEDGVFDFEHLDYGQVYVTDGYASSDFSATAGNVELLVDGRYRFWNADKTLRLYKAGTADGIDYDNASLILAAPAGYFITAIDFGVNAEALVPDEGSITSNTWTGIANTVTFTHDGTSSSVNIKKITVTYTNTYTRTVTSGNYGTLCLPYDATVAGATLYSIADKDASSITVTEAGTTAAAGVPYIFKATGDELVATYTGATYTAAGTANGLHGTYSDIDFADVAGYSDGDYYVVLPSKIQAASSKSGVDAFRAYIVLDEITSSPGVKGIRLGFDGTEEATAITELTEKTEATEGVIYNLHGQRVNNLQRGINIVGGRKVLVK